MTLYDLYVLATDHSVATSIVGFIGAILIEKSKTIKLNPFSFIGDLLTGRIMRTVEENHEEDRKAREELNQRINALEESMAKARQDSIDRYELSCQKYDELKEDLRYEITSSTMKQYRVDFFRFAEGIKRGVSYTKEHWHNIRNKILEYKKYCMENDQFINSECEDTIQTILDAWELHPWENNNE